MVIFLFVAACAPPGPLGVGDPSPRPPRQNHEATDIKMRAEEAIQIAERALQSEKTFDKANQPFQAEKDGTLWIVTGTVTIKGAPEVHVLMTGGVERIVYRFQPRTHSAPLIDGTIPDAATAIRVARAIWNPQRIGADDAPKATLAQGAWTVVSGAAGRLILSRKDGRVLSHIASAPVLENAAMAMSVADAVLTAIYGSKALRRQQPLAVGKRQGNWIVEGTLPQSSDNILVRGGGAHIVIRASDAKVLQVTHGR